MQDESGNPFAKTASDGFQKEGCGRMRTPFVGPEMKRTQQFASPVENQIPPSVETQTAELAGWGSAVAAAEEIADGVNVKFVAPVDMEFAAAADVKTAAQLNVVVLDDFVVVAAVAAFVAPAVAVVFVAHAAVVVAAPVVEAFAAPADPSFHLVATYEPWATVLALV